VPSAFRAHSAWPNEQECVRPPGSASVTSYASWRLPSRRVGLVATEGQAGASAPVPLALAAPTETHFFTLK